MSHFLMLMLCITESRQSGSWDPEQYAGADQWSRFSRSSAVNAGRGSRSNGSSAVSSSAGHHWALEPWGTDQYFLGRQVRQHSALLLLSFVC